MVVDKEEGEFLLKKIHFPRKSVFSVPASINIRGLYNLMFLLIIFSNFRTIVNSVSEYGILFNFQTVHSFFVPLLSLVLEITAISYTILILGLFVEKLAFKKKISENVTNICHIVSSFFLLMIPVAITKSRHVPIIMASICLQMSTVYMMKLWSYICVNYYLRNGYSIKADSGTKYPDNLNIKDMTYYFLAPTLCYEPNFPRNADRNYVKIGFLILRLLLVVMIELGITQQVVIPILIATYNEGNIFSKLKIGENRINLVCIIEYIYQLAVPSMILWVLFFYGIFHCYLNLISEILLFADRQFYLDWWNSTSVSSFWRRWNVPVHTWLLRHVHEPLQKKGYSKMSSVVIVFTLSAFFHEYVISVPLGITKYWAALSMLVQIPIHIILRFISNFQARNFIFWTTMIIGQPFIFTMYFLEYMRIHNINYIDIYSILKL